MPPDLEARAEMQFRAWLDAHPPASEDAIVVGPDDRWIASSAWQKSIRRGDATLAARLVRGLWRLDPAYVRRRLPIILLEDVGWGDPELTLVGMLACGRTRWWPASDDATTAVMVTQRAAHAVKDRSSVDLAVAVDRMTLTDTRVATLFATAEVAPRIAVANDDGRSPFERLAALWSLAGTGRYPGDHVDAPHPLPRPDLEAFVQDLAGGTLRLETWRIGRIRMRDALPIAALISGEYAGEPLGVDDERSLIPADEWIGRFPASAFDQHTRLGRAAVAVFVATCVPWRRWLSTWSGGTRVHRELTHRFLYRVESGVLDRRLAFAWSREIASMPLEATCATYQIPSSEIPVGKALLRDNLPALNSVRRLVAARQQSTERAVEHPLGLSDRRHRNANRSRPDPTGGPTGRT